MDSNKTYTRKTVNRLRAAQEQIRDLAGHARTQAAKWLKTDAGKLNVPVPLQFTGEGSDMTLLVRRSLGGDQFGEDWIEHQMPVNYLFASDEDLEEDFQKFQELRARFEPTADPQ